MSPSQTVSLPTTPTNTNTNATLCLDKTSSELYNYLHADAGCPTKSAFIQAINNVNFITWSGITTKLIPKHLPPYIPTLKVHLNQKKKHICSTKPIPTTLKLEVYPPPNQESNTQEYLFTLTAQEYEATYSDLTGIYPIISIRGNFYIVIFY